MGVVVTIISTEIILPSFFSSRSLNRINPKPFKLSLLDQLTAATYFPFIFFYPHSPQNAGAFTARLKSSLARALSTFYPFAGIVKNNLVVDDFQNGVSFLEARVSSDMSEFLSGPKTASLNDFLPCLPWRYPDAPTRLLAVQVSEFLCGGLAIGVCASHKIADAACLIAFLNEWAAKTRENDENDCVLVEELNDVSFRFTPKDSLPVRYTSVYEKLWFSRADFRTERFVFDAKALAKLTDLAITDLQRVNNKRPSRVQALCGFIWKTAMEAAKSTARTSLACQVVNLRRDSPGRRVGNTFWWATAVHNPESATAAETELPSLVEKLSESVAETKQFFMKPAAAEEAYAAVGDLLRLLEELWAVEEPEIYAFTSWVNLGLDDVDFGLGRAVWVGTFGEVGPEFRSLVVVKDETTKGNGIEAWLTFEEKVLTKLRSDPEFLTFASVDPPVVIV